MPQRIKLRNSVVEGQKPDPADLAIGEVCVGAHPDTPGLIFKDSDNNIIELTPSGGAVTSVNGETGDVVLDAADVGAVTIGDVNPTYFANQAAFPDASSSAVHGGVAHSHADGAMFFAHNGTWNELANASDVGGGLWELVGNSVEPITPNQNVVVPEKLYVGVRNPDVADDGGLITYDATYNEFILDCVKSNLTANLKLDGRITVGTVTAANFDIDALDPLPA